MKEPIQIRTAMVSSLGGGQSVSLGDFVPQVLVCVGPRHQSRLWAIGYCRSETSTQKRIYWGGAPMSPRESFVLAWQCLSRGLSTMRLQAKLYFRTQCSSVLVRFHRQNPLSNWEYPFPEDRSSPRHSTQPTAISHLRLSTVLHTPGSSILMPKLRVRGAEVSPMIHDDSSRSGCDRSYRMIKKVVQQGRRRS